MKILQYLYRDVDDPGWNFTNVEFGKINLLVGNTATGKTRLLNTIFNLGRFVVSKEFKNGNWNIIFEHAGIIYEWSLETEKRQDDDAPGIIIKDHLQKKDGQSWVILVERDKDKFIFMGEAVPKLSPKETSISLLKEEEVIKPLNQAFSNVMRRLFSYDELSKVSEIQVLPISLDEKMGKKKDLNILYHGMLNVSSNLFLLSKYFEKMYDNIIKQYIKIFPFIQEAKITDFAKLNPTVSLPGITPAPVFTIQEHGTNKWIPVNEFSSGMQKVLLILTDIFLMPDDSVYIIEEYENSLGINAIDFFPQFILELEKNVQFFISSHHPYVINEIPINNWYVFHRNKMEVSIKYGKEISEKYAKSKQRAFSQLINDPIFIKGVE